MSTVPKRCQLEGCKCKLTLTSFPCRCQKHFCEKHRYSDDHSCTHDFKADHKKELNKYMSSPIVHAKVEVI